MADYILVTETGSDIHEETARRHGIVVVPMHVNFGEVSRDDDSFPPEELYEYYKTTGKLPQTSGCTPVDFSAAFDRIHEKYPTAKILYLAYSAATTVSYRSAHLAAEGRDYVTGADVQYVFRDVCAHRVLLKQDAVGADVDSVLGELLKKVENPDRHGLLSGMFKR